MNNNKIIMLKERIEFDILTSLNDVKANTEDMIKKNICQVLVYVL